MKILLCAVAVAVLAGCSPAVDSGVPSATGSPAPASTPSSASTSKVPGATRAPSSAVTPSGPQEEPAGGGALEKMLLVLADLPGKGAGLSASRVESTIPDNTALLNCSGVEPNRSDAVRARGRTFSAKDSSVNVGSTAVTYKSANSALRSIAAYNDRTSQCLIAVAVPSITQTLNNAGGTVDTTRTQAGLFGTPVAKLPEGVTGRASFVSMSVVTNAGTTSVTLVGVTLVVKNNASQITLTLIGGDAPTAGVQAMVNAVADKMLKN